MERVVEAGEVLMAVLVHEVDRAARAETLAGVSSLTRPLMAGKVEKEAQEDMEGTADRAGTEVMAATAAS